MADKSGSETQEAIETVAEAIGETASLENALEAAVDAQEDAEEAAERIAEAALESERMRQVDAIRQETEQWRNAQSLQIEALTNQVTQLRTQLTEALSALATPPQVTVTTTPTPEAETLLTPPPSPEATPGVTVTVDPAAAGAAPQVQEAAPAREKKVRFL